MNLVFNPGIYTLWNQKQIIENRRVPLAWSTAEAFYSDEFNLSRLFKMTYSILTNMIYNLSKDVHLSWSDFNEMPFFEIMMIVEAHNDFVERQEKSGGDQNDVIAQQQAQMESTFRQQQAQMAKPQIPQIPQFNIPH